MYTKKQQIKKNSNYSPPQKKYIFLADKGFAPLPP